MIRTALLVPLLLALLAGPALSQTQVEISADQLTVEETRSEAVFTGNVKVVHPTVTVWAPRVVAIYGEGGTSDIESFTASGGVRLKTKDQDATGENAVFTPSDQLLRLTGNVKVTNSSGTVNATELVVNLETDVSTFTGGGGGRVTGVFTSQ
ncbi:MAG: hypothetical protein KIT02_13265 [Devosia sp.]|uniref:LptA/OstA family protein n=1 Tax=Devosia sp. TaxID=1871048 RepID=UPI0024CDC616|nr:LptA/OstA family protein [Devosia sp.]UYN98893.1 MAG: hypothetical protein KIT02_13265 [Devosia sp.]